MLEGRKYVLNINAGIVFGKTKYPADANLAGIIQGNLDGIGMLIHMDDVDIDPVIVMDEKQCKALIKAIKKVKRGNRKKWRRG